MHLLRFPLWLAASSGNVYCMSTFAIGISSTVVLYQQRFQMMQPMVLQTSNVVRYRVRMRKPYSQWRVYNFTIPYSSRRVLDDTAHPKRAPLLTTSAWAERKATHGRHCGPLHQKTCFPRAQLSRKATRAHAVVYRISHQNNNTLQHNPIITPRR